MDILIREIREGRISSEAVSLAVVDVVLNQRILESYDDFESQESEQHILSVRWEQEHPLTSTVTLETTGDQSDRELVKAIEEDLSPIKILIRRLYKECEMMLMTMSVSPLVLTIQHPASDTFRKCQKALVLILKEFLHYYVRNKLEWNIRISRLSNLPSVITSITNGDANDRNWSMRNSTRANEKRLQERFSKIEKEMADQQKLFEEHCQKLQFQQKCLKAIIAKILDGLQIRDRIRNQKRDIVTSGKNSGTIASSMNSVDGEKSLGNESAIKEQHSEKHTETHSSMTEQPDLDTDREKSAKTENSFNLPKQGDGDRKVLMKETQNINAQKKSAESYEKTTKVYQTERQTSGEETILGILTAEEDTNKDYSHKSKTKGKQRIRCPRIDYKALPREKVEDYREACREWGISKDDAGTEGADGATILAALTRLQANYQLRAEVRKHKLDSTKSGRTSIKNLLANDAFAIKEGEERRTSLWQGVMDTMKSEERMREEGLDTVICIHSSYGLDERAFQAVEEFVLALLVGLDDETKTHEVRENVGLVATDDETPVIHHLDGDLQQVKGKIKDLGIPGLTSKMKIRPSSLNKTFLLGLSALSKAGFCTFGELTIPPRMFIMTDGIKGDITSPEQAELRSVLRAVGSDHIRKTLFEPIVWIPIGKPNQDSIRKMVHLSKGALYDAEIKSLTSYQAIKRVSADVIAYMRSDVDSDESHLEKALEAVVGNKLASKDKRSISRFVAHKLTKMPRELGEIDNFENVNIMDNLPPHGSRVVRGPDWRYDDQDSGLPGTVVNHDGERIWVLWDNKMCASYGYSRSCGYDVVITDEPGKQVDELSIGRRVARGPHWCYGNEDGGVGSTGVIIRAKKGLLKVRWENGNIHDYRFDSDVFEIWVQW